MNRGGLAEDMIVQWSETLQQHVRDKILIEWLSFEKWSLCEAAETQKAPDSNKQPGDSQIGDEDEVK